MTAPQPSPRCPQCKWCISEGPPEWSKHAKVWIHRRPTLDKACLNPPKHDCCPACGGQFEPHGQCSQCGEYPTPVAEEKPRPTDEAKTIGEFLRHDSDTCPCKVCVQFRADYPPRAEVGAQPPADHDFREHPDFWPTIWDLEARWQKIWRGDRAKYADKYPKWLLDAAAELFAHDMCDAWAWNDYVSAAAVIIDRHYRGASSPAPTPAIGPTVADIAKSCVQTNAGAPTGEGAQNANENTTADSVHLRSGAGQEVDCVPVPAVVPSGGAPLPKSFHAAWGGPNGHGQVVKLEDALAYAASSNAQLQKLQIQLKNCGGDNCMGQKVKGCATWVREERLKEAESKVSTLKGELQRERAKHSETRELMLQVAGEDQKAINAVRGELREARQERRVSAQAHANAEQEIERLASELERLRAGERG